MKTSDDVPKRFNEIQWHDSKLTGITISDNGKNYQLALRVQILSAPLEERFTDTIVLFKGSRVIQCDVDLLGIELVGGDIGGAICSFNSPLKQKIVSEKSDRFDLPEVRSQIENTHHFSIGIIHPGGEFNILAEDFEVIAV